MLLVGVDDAEGPPVPIPNTEVKLCGAEDSALATRCENREMPILVASFFFEVFYYFFQIFKIKLDIFARLCYNNSCDNSEHMERCPSGLRS